MEFGVNIKLHNSHWIFMNDKNMITLSIILWYVTDLCSAEFNLENIKTYFI